MLRGSAGAKALRIGILGRDGVGRTVGLLGAAGTSYRIMVAYRQIFSHLGRRLLSITKQHKISRDISGKCSKQFRRNPLVYKPNGRAKPSTRQIESMATLGSGSMGLNLLILLVGRGSHVKALEELKELTQVMQSLLQIIGRQCKLQTAERIRRGLQLYSVYSRLWGEEAARAALKSLRRTLVARGKGILLSAICFTKYDWDANKITEDRLRSSVRDLDSVGDLCKATVACDHCGKRQVIDKQMTDIEYCTCDNGQLGYTNTSRVYESWEPFIERSHHIVWRQRHHVHQHLFAYKVYGTYDDVSLSAFMEVHLNSDFRTEWDDTALQLRVLDSQKESNSDLIYWLVKYPQFFSNRDYVYKRRFLWNKEKQEVVIMSEAVPSDTIVPEEKDIHRVNEYWSTMVIRAKENANEPGIEYTLTYFDNPGTSLPQWLTNFIAVTGFPSFLEKLHNAALSLQAVHEKGNDVYVSLPSELRYPRPVLKRPAVPELYITDAPVGVDVRLLETQATDEAKSLSKEISLGNEIQKKISIVDNTCDATELSDKDEEPPFTKIVVTELLLEVSEEVNITGPEKMDDSSVKESRTSIESMIQEGESKMKTTKVERQEEDPSVSERNVKSADKALHVYRGNKKVTVDILEAMEVVAPDLDKPTSISKNIERLTSKAIEELEKNTVLSAKLRKLKNRLKLFQEHALHKKEVSIQKMNELEKRTRYDSYDPMTRMHLDRLFVAIQEVLQADKDMRTGKGLLQDSSEENALFDRESFKPIFLPKVAEKTECQSSEGPVAPDEKRSDKVNADSKRKSESKSKDEPPPPPPPTPPSQLLDSVQASDNSNESSNSGETTSNEIETYNGMRSINDLQNNNSYSTWKPWTYIPYLSAWWESSSSEDSSESTHEECTDLQGENKYEESEKSSTDSIPQSFASHVWYVVGLGWILSAKAEVSDESEVSSEESSVSRQMSNTERDDSSRQSWYSLDSVYRLYAWAFKSTTASA